MRWNSGLVTGPGPALLLATPDRVLSAWLSTFQRGGAQDGLRVTWRAGRRDGMWAGVRTLVILSISQLSRLLSVPGLLVLGGTNVAAVFRAAWGGERRWPPPAAFLESIQKGVWFEQGGKSSPLWSRTQRWFYSRPSS